MSARSRNVAAVLAVLLVAGMLLIAFAGGRLVLEATGMVVVGLAAIGLVAGGFYLVGRSEDRERGDI